MKKYIIVLGIIVIAIVVFNGYSLNSKKEVIMDKDAENDAKLMQENKELAEKEMMEDKKVLEKEGENNELEVRDYAEMPVGSYEAYSPEKIFQKASTGNVVLFFRASWCPTCRALDKDIRANENNIPKSLTILDVDYDNSTELKKKYGVTYQHTMIQVDKDGKLLKKWMGSPDLASFVKEVI